MIPSSVFLARLFELLNVSGTYAVLRNYEGLPLRNPSRDIDLVMERQTYLRLKGKLLAWVEEAGWRVLTYLHSDRLVTWVCACVDESSRTEIVQLDFFFHTSVFGIRLLEAKSLLKGRRFNGAVYHVSPAYEFLDKYLYDRAVGAAYPEKYRHIREAAQANEEVLQVLNTLFGEKSVEACDQAKGKALLLRAFLRNLRRHPFLTLARLWAFLYYYLRNYACSDTGFSIGFTGPDGAGKTTVIDLMLSRLSPVFKAAHKYFHFRPALFGNLGEVAHSVGVKKEVDRNYSAPHRGGKTGVLSSVVRLLYYSADYVAGYFVKVKPETRITRLVVFDRYFTDIVCDSRRSRIYLPPKFLYVFGKLFIPSLDYNVLLTASTETILRRKRELDAQGVERINAQIDFLASKKGFLKVMNEHTAEEAVAQLQRHVFDNQHRKNVKRI